MRPEETSDGSSQSSHGILASVPQKSDDEVGPLPNSGSEYSKLSLDSKAENCLSPADNSAQLDDAMYCFKYLLVFNAFLESFSHGANDTANSTAPFSAVYSVYYHGEDACEKISSNAWIMILAGIFVAIGVITYGEKVIVTVGEKLTKIDYQKGFCIEFSSCVTVVIATILHLPVSTTHCQIGSVVFVGLVSLGYKHVCWSAVGSILIAWFVTVPIAATVAVIVTSLVQQWL